MDDILLFSSFHRRKSWLEKKVMEQRLIEDKLMGEKCWGEEKLMDGRSVSSSHQFGPPPQQESPPNKISSLNFLFQQNIPHHFTSLHVKRVYTG